MTDNESLPTHSSEKDETLRSEYLRLTRPLVDASKTDGQTEFTTIVKALDPNRLQLAMAQSANRKLRETLSGYYLPTIKNCFERYQSSPDEQDKTFLLRAGNTDDIVGKLVMDFSDSTFRADTTTGKKLDSQDITDATRTIVRFVQKQFISTEQKGPHVGVRLEKVPGMDHVFEYSFGPGSRTHFYRMVDESGASIETLHQKVEEFKNNPTQTGPVFARLSEGESPELHLDFTVLTDTSAGDPRTTDSATLSV